MSADVLHIGRGSRTFHGPQKPHGATPISEDALLPTDKYHLPLHSDLRRHFLLKTLLKFDGR
jgi:hypothetical protein